MGSALHHGYLLVAGDDHPGGVVLLLQLHVEYLGDVGVIHADKGDCKHHVALGAHLQLVFGGVGLVEGGYRGCYDLLGGCFDSHAEEQDHQDADDRDGNESAHGAFVVGAAVVAQQLGVGEEVQLSQQVSYAF